MEIQPGLLGKYDLQEQLGRGGMTEGGVLDTYAILYWLPATSLHKRDGVHHCMSPVDPSFPAFFPGSGSLQEDQGCPAHDGFPFFPQVSSAF
jgi:hypothetical protein